jgi:hypothetical protein
MSSGGVILIPRLRGEVKDDECLVMQRLAGSRAIERTLRLGLRGVGRLVQAN